MGPTRPSAGTIQDQPQGNDVTADEKARPALGKRQFAKVRPRQWWVYLDLDQPRSTADLVQRSGLVWTSVEVHLRALRSLGIIREEPPGVEGSSSRWDRAVDLDLDQERTARDKVLAARLAPPVEAATTGPSRGGSGNKSARARLGPVNYRCHCPCGWSALFGDQRSAEEARSRHDGSGACRAIGKVHPTVTPERQVRRAATPVRPLSEEKPGLSTNGPQYRCRCTCGWSAAFDDQSSATVASSRHRGSGECEAPSDASVSVKTETPTRPERQAPARLPSQPTTTAISSSTPAPREDRRDVPAYSGTTRMPTSLPRLGDINAPTLTTFRPPAPKSGSGWWRPALVLALLGALAVAVAVWSGARSGGDATLADPNPTLVATPTEQTVARSKVCQQAESLRDDEATVAEAAYVFESTGQRVHTRMKKECPDLFQYVQDAHIEQLAIMSTAPTPSVQSSPQPVPQQQADGGVPPDLASRGVTASMISRIHSTAVATTYTFEGDDPANSAYLAVIVCDNVSSGATDFDAEQQDAIASGADPSDAATWSAFLEQEICPDLN